MRMTKRDILYFVLPAILWPIVFIGLSGVFVYAMLIAAVCV